LREEKYEWLDHNNFDKKNYQEINPTSPWYFFIPRDTQHIQQYLQWKGINEIFPVNVSGIVTARDKFVIGFDKIEIRNRILQFRNLSLPDDIIKQTFNLKDTRGWKLSSARKKLSEDPNWNSYYQNILYRPFDVRAIYYSEDMVDWGRPEVMRHMLEENIGIIARRQQLPDRSCNYFFISQHLISDGVIRSDNKGSESLFPLYIYPDENKKDIFNQHKIKKEPNIPIAIFQKLQSAYRRKLVPEEILYYIYSIVYSNIYRETYAEFLKFDFPRVPITADYELLKKMSRLGKKLANLHMLKSSVLDSPITKYQGSGDNDRIEKIVYKENEERVYINTDKYFEGINPEVWNYHIGGYQVLKKYLKDRKNRNMEDAPRYCRIVTALSKTIEIQKEIDKIYPEVEKKLIQFS
jgi:predicted helicase